MSIIDQKDLFGEWIRIPEQFILKVNEQQFLTYFKAFDSNGHTVTNLEGIFEYAILKKDNKIHFFEIADFRPNDIIDAELFIFLKHIRSTDEKIAKPPV